MNLNPVFLLFALPVLFSCNNSDPKSEKERACFYQETMLGFEYIVNDHYNRYKETFGTFYTGEENEQQKKLKNVFDANFELKGIVDYRMIEEDKSEDEKRQLLFDELNVFVNKNVANVPEYYQADFRKYIREMKFDKEGFEDIQVSDSTDRNMFMTKAHMITTRAVQMNY